MKAETDSSLRAAIASDHPEFDSGGISPSGWVRLERLAQASPLYAQGLRRRPQTCLWLEEERNLRAAYRYQALLDEWRAFAAPAGADLVRDEIYVSLLRQWRRLMSLRIAYRSVNELADEPATVAELTQLAEYCLRECLHLARRHWTAVLGEPRTDAGEPARFCVLAFGKLGGGELNFSSDIDLVYCYEGDGFCRRDGLPTTTDNLEFFTQMAEGTNRLLAAQTADGFLFRVDTRLRPHGAWGPLVQSLSAIENAYASVGQTWERLALLKARPVAGDLELGAELLEDLHDFRYPRRPPPSLLAEVAAMKARTEREAVRAEAAARDVKRGPGGIREIEFIAQSLQLLHAGLYPFLQTHSTAQALASLARYGLLAPDDAAFLTSAYWHLRRVEHRLQMRDERQTHLLPADAGELAAVAASLGFASAEDFRADLDRRRGRVRALYAEFFADREIDGDFEAWWEFFTSDKTPAPVAARIHRWFGDAPGAEMALRVFVCGDHRLQITRELVTRFQQLALNFDALIPELAQPLATLARLARCAERYGTRQQFLNHCASHPQLLRVLALLCDRSSTSVELLSAHPEILEEVLRPEMLRRRKQPRDLAAELAAGPAPDEAGFPAWLWLYVRAEQLRYTVDELLGVLSPVEVESALSRLADAVLTLLARKTGLLVVALGKYGGNELSLGSDLDLLIVAGEGAAAAAAGQVQSWHRLLQTGGPLGPIFAVDLRLRPFGEAGPLVTTLPALAAYHRGEAGTWEKQLLTQARIVTGPPKLAAAFAAWTEALLYGAPWTEAAQKEIWAMRARIERERAGVVPPQRAFKAGAGGLIDTEFLVQTLQLQHGASHPALRRSGIRPNLRALSAAGVMPADTAARLLEHYGFLKRVEFAVRRDANQGISVLAATPQERTPLARWLGYPTEAAFWEDLVRRLRETRRIVRALGGPPAETALPP